jgi:hypothetical protein
MEATFSQRLERVIARARRTYASFRPEVAEYLFKHGWQPTAQGLNAPGEPLAVREAVLEHLWTLHMETIGTRMFGVSTDAWRGNAAYPDRYFPIVWLDVVPKLVPRIAQEKRVPALAALFNLGENLVANARAASSIVAESLRRDLDAMAREGVEIVAMSALAEAGLVPRGVAAPRARGGESARLVARAPFDVASVEPRFVPGAIACHESAYAVCDLQESTSIVFSIAGELPQLVGRRAVKGAQPPSGLPHAAKIARGTISIGADGAVVLTDDKGGARPIGRLDPRGVLGVAIGDSGTIAVTRRFSQRIELHQLDGAPP